MRGRWSKEQANAWYEEHPWLMGCNYVPSNTLLWKEIWLDETRDEVAEWMKKELALMQEIGMNTARIHLPFDVWYFEREKFFTKMDDLLALLDSYGVSMLAIIFNDCASFVRPNPVFPEKLPTDWLPYAIGHHGGEVENPFIGEETKVGWILFDEEEWVEPQFQYERELISRYKDDPRIIGWDLWNEPGNSNRYEKSLGLLERCFEIARECDPIQPLTAGVWRFPEGYGVDDSVKLDIIQERSIELSDVISYHHYGDFESVKTVTEKLLKEGRPLINTEWMNRILDNFLVDILPYFHEKKIGSYNWGLVAGKSQHYLPWDYLRTIPGLDCSRWQHDLFHEDLTPYDEEEIELIKKLSPKK